MKNSTEMFAVESEKKGWALAEKYLSIKSKFLEKNFRQKPNSTGNHSSLYFAFAFFCRLIFDDFWNIAADGVKRKRVARNFCS